MLAVCIPIYNFDVTELATQLEQQITTSPFEILLIDDCSLQEYKSINHTICKKHTYIELDKNIGRAKIRNLFLSYSSADYLLFLDCDSKITSNSFIENYIAAIQNNTKTAVFCGGRVYQNKPPSRNQQLSWKYGIKRESKSVKERANNPYQSFMTNNFVVQRSVLASIPFDERLTQYGHEDTLFGYALKQSSHPILHLDNPILNGDIETNESYLQKTHLAIENLVTILETTPNKESFIADIKLLSFYYQLKQLHITKPVFFLAPVINRLFLGLMSNYGIVSLTLFNYYKLYYLHLAFHKKSRLN